MDKSLKAAIPLILFISGLASGILNHMILAGFLILISVFISVFVIISWDEI